MNFYGLSSKRRRSSGPPETWTQNADPSFDTDNIYFAFYGSDGYWVATGANNKIATCNGVPTGTWTQRTSNITSGAIFQSHYADGYWLVVAQHGDYAYQSDPTGSWTKVDLASKFGTNNILTVTSYLSSVWIMAGGSGNLVYATNDPPTTWSSITSQFGTSSINRVVYENSLYVAIGADGKCSTSTNLTTWTARTSSFSTDHIYDIGYGDGYWVTVGASGKMAYSTDPTSSFTQITGGNNPFSGTAIYGVGYGNGQWVAVGAGGKLATTDDPTGVWSLQTSSFGTDQIRNVAYGNGYWVAVGGNGKLATAVNGA